MQKVNIAEKFTLFTDYFSPKIIGDLNDSYVKVAKLKGEFTWHKHDNEDELFLIIKGILRIQFEESEVELHPGELLIIPKGVLHCPVAEEEVHVILIEPKTTLNTGDVNHALTKQTLDRI